jgi:glycosyltransferase involved in cell wall biosynthesis
MPTPFAGRTLGFVGNLETKIDIPLLSRVAERFPDCRLVLVGSTHANPAVLELLRFPNVRMPGVVPYDRLGAWLATFDVGLIPHLSTDLTRYMNPLKAYVYLAAGVPVVSTAVPNVAVADGLITTGDSHDAFLERIAERLDGPRVPRERFDDFTRANDWAARLAPHVDALGLSAQVAARTGPTPA